WGARFAPKVMVRQDGQLIQKFGWHTPAAGREYKAFLKAFLPVLTRHLKARGLQERCLFHISDEPSKTMIDSFKQAATIVKPLLKGFKVIDALSDIDFYHTGLVDTPIPANDHIEPFVAAGVPE